MVVTPPAPTPTPTLPTRDPARFDLTFWNEFIHNAYEGPQVALRRLTAPPMLYLKTVDDAGQTVDSATLQSTETTLRDTASSWTGGLFGLAGVQRGTGTMQGQHGWVTVTWTAAVTSYCGQSDVGVDGGVITLALNTPGCGCPGGVTTSRIRPRTVAHELGHAFGFWHTDNALDLMHVPSNNCLQTPDDRELYHAGLAYQTPNSSTSSLHISSAPILD